MGATRCELPYEDDSFDAATVGFGARNFTDLPRGLRSWCASCARAGEWWCSRSRPPHGAPLSLFYRLWFDRIVPALGQPRGLARVLGFALRGAPPQAAIADAYTYLPNSVKRFPAPAALAAEMERAGLREIGYVLTAGGIVAIHAGTVPAERA